MTQRVNPGPGKPATAQPDNEVLIPRLQALFETELARFGGSGADYALLDFPNHGNVGDSAIYVGEVIALKKLFGRGPTLVTEASDHDFDRVAALDSRAPIFLHGGGNFGDLWPRHQLFREAVLRRFPDRRVIQLPQSIHFREEASLSRAASAVNMHPDFTLMVRDETSAAIARQKFDCAVCLVPDAAFMIGPVAPLSPADQEVVCIIRQDHESILGSTAALARLPEPSLVADWPREHIKPTLVARLPRRLRQWLPPKTQGYWPATPAAYEWLARKRVDNGLQLLSRGKVVLTDRLHAHILSLLLGKPHVVLDNHYGKISSFIAAFTSGAQIPQVRDLSAAVKIAASLSEKN